MYILTYSCMCTQPHHCLSPGTVTIAPFPSRYSVLTLPLHMNSCHECSGMCCVVSVSLWGTTMEHCTCTCDDYLLPTVHETIAPFPSRWYSVLTLPLHMSSCHECSGMCCVVSVPLCRSAGDKVVSQSVLVGQKWSIVFLWHNLIHCLLCTALHVTAHVHVHANVCLSYMDKSAPAKH